MAKKSKRSKNIKNTPDAELKKASPSIKIDEKKQNYIFLILMAGILKKPGG